MLKRHAELMAQDFQAEPVAPVPNLKAQAHQAVFRQAGIQPQDTIAHLNAGIATFSESPLPLPESDRGVEYCRICGGSRPNQTLGAQHSLRTD